MTAWFSAILATSRQHTCDTAVTQRHEYESTRRQRALRAEPYHPATGWTRQWADTAAEARTWSQRLIAATRDGPAPATGAGADRHAMQLVLLTSESKPESVLPALSLLPHHLRMGALELTTMIAEPVDVIIVDARSLLPAARSICQALVRLEPNTPVVAVFTEGGLVVLPAGWPLDEFLLTQSGAAEVDTRLRLVSDRKRCSVEKARADDVSGPIVLDDCTYTVRINGPPVAFTYIEFALLRYLLRHLDRVLTRTRLLTDVWGYDYIGTSRTVDSHISRIRTKLGEHCSLRICAVRKIGYRASL